MKIKKKTVILVALAVLHIGGCGMAWGQEISPSWVRVAKSSPWVPRDSSGELVYQGKMWLLGGWPGSMLDVWSSADGVNWKLATRDAPWVHCDVPTTLVYKGKMWFMAGWQGTGRSTGSAGNKVWSSSDGANWHCVTNGAPWVPRVGAGGVVFDGKMWVLGGTTEYHKDSKHLLNDVWYSSDGKNWQLATAHAPWAPRAFHAALVFDGKIWVFGGGNYGAHRYGSGEYPEYLGYNDVWNSSDGVNWTKVTDHAQWHPRIWFSSVVYKKRMWVLGGWSSSPTQNKNWNDAWYSSDGVNWKELTTDTVWSQRHEMSPFVFKDKLWLMGGNGVRPVTNEVWQIEIPDSWFEQQ